MKRIRAAVIGTGYLGRFHADKYAALPEAELVAVVDADVSRAGAVAEKHGAAAFESYRDVLGKVDAVSVVTPTETHFEIGREFLSRGVHVLMEKPMTRTEAEAGELIDVAEKAGAVLQVGHLERFNAAVVELKGRLTRPIYMEAHRLARFPNRGADVDVVLDLMIHDIDIILNLVGSEIESVDAAGLPVITDKPDIVSARLRFKNGCVANATASRVSIEPVRKIDVYEADSYVAIDYARQQMTTYRTGSEGGALLMVGEPHHLEKRDTIMEEIRSFLKSITDGTAPLVSGADGKRAIEVARLVQDSVRRSMERFAGK
jgi:predicted dehydrogenase